MLFGPVVTDWMDPHDLAIDRQLHRRADDRDLDLRASPRPPPPIPGPGEAAGAVGVGDPGDRRSGCCQPDPARLRRPARRLGIARSETLRVGGHEHAGVQDLDQAALAYDFYWFTCERRPHPIAEPGQADPAPLI